MPEFDMVGVKCLFRQALKNSCDLLAFFQCFQWYDNLPVAITWPKYSTQARIKLG